jgi:hypothetical protein
MPGVRPFRCYTCLLEPPPPLRPPQSQVLLVADRFTKTFNPTSWLDDIFRTYRSEAPALRMKNEKKKEGIYESTYDLVINK